MMGGLARYAIDSNDEPLNDGDGQLALNSELVQGELVKVDERLGRALKSGGGDKLQGMVAEIQGDFDKRNFGATFQSKKGLDEHVGHHVSKADAVTGSYGDQFGPSVPNKISSIRQQD